MTYEAAFWFMAGLSLMGAALVIHAVEYAFPLVVRRVAGLGRSSPALEECSCEAEVVGDPPRWQRLWCSSCTARQEME